MADRAATTAFEQNLSVKPERNPRPTEMTLDDKAARELGVPKASTLLPAQYAYWLACYPGPQNGDPVE